MLLAIGQYFVKYRLVRLTRPKPRVHRYSIPKLRPFIVGKGPSKGNLYSTRHGASTIHHYRDTTEKTHKNGISSHPGQMSFSVSLAPTDLGLYPPTGKAPGVAP